MEQVLLAEPRGFCAGVDRAIEIVERALEKFGRPIYVRHEIVHNTHVVNDLKQRGAIFIEELSEVPPGAKGTTMRRGWRGQVAASAGAPTAASASEAEDLRKVRRWVMRCLL